MGLECPRAMIIAQSVAPEKRPGHALNPQTDLPNLVAELAFRWTCRTYGGWLTPAGCPWLLRDTGTNRKVAGGRSPKQFTMFFSQGLVETGGRHSQSATSHHLSLAADACWQPQTCNTSCLSELRRHMPYSGRLSRCVLLQGGSNTCVGKAPRLLSPFLPAAPSVAAGAACRGKAYHDHAYAAFLPTLGFICKAINLSAIAGGLQCIRSHPLNPVLSSTRGQRVTCTLGLCLPPTPSSVCCRRAAICS